MGHRRVFELEDQVALPARHRVLTCKSCTEQVGSCIISTELSPGFNIPAGGVFDGQAVPSWQCIR